MSQSLYDILGVSEDASQEDIKKAWKSAARAYHPDRGGAAGGNHEKFSKINAAYDTLKDPQKRAEYDMHRRHGGMGGDFDTGFSYQGRGPSSVDAMFEELFAHMFEAQRRAQPRVIDMPVSVEDLCQGVKKIANLRKSNGGTDKVAISIPAGATPGQMLKMRTEHGDLVIRLKLKEHDHYTIHGDDLYMRLRVPLHKAIEGDIVKVEDPYGHTHTLTLPEGLQSGTRFELHGRGMPSIIGRGNLYIVVHVDTPSGLTKEQKKAIRDICQGKDVKEKPSMWDTIRETVGF